MTLFVTDMEAAAKANAMERKEAELERLAATSTRERLAEKRIAAYRERQASRSGIWARLKARLGVL